MIVTHTWFPQRAPLVDAQLSWEETSTAPLLRINELRAARPGLDRWSSVTSHWNQAIQYGMITAANYLKLGRASGVLTTDIDDIEGGVSNSSTHQNDLEWGLKVKEPQYLSTQRWISPMWACNPFPIFAGWILFNSQRGSIHCDYKYLDHFKVAVSFLRRVRTLNFQLCLPGWHSMTMNNALRTLSSTVRVLFYLF